MKQAGVWIAASAVLLSSNVFSAGSFTVNPGDACSGERQESYTDGFNAGNSQGLNSGFSNGYSQGADDGAAWCRANPDLCGVTLASCLPAPTFGETEPNDNLVSADGLPFDVNFWGQSYGAADEDWFYIVTTQPNQNLTINFSTPSGSLSGWKVSIRDAAGNLFADFDTSIPGNVAAPQGEVAYRVTLGFAGTYYLVVDTADTAQVYSTYNIAAVLQDSPLDGANFVVGFYDVGA